MDRFSPEEIDELIERYFNADGYEFAVGFEHRYEPYSSKVCYSLIRLLKPTNVVEFGTSRGGATSFIQAALLKNGKPFNYLASEKEPDLLEAAKKHVMEKNGSIPTMVGDIQENIDKVPEIIDFAFIDSNHDEALTIWYLEHIIGRMRVGAVLALHDWDVKDGPDGTYTTKAGNGSTSFPETQLLFEMFKDGTFPFKRLYWTSERHPNTESSFWEYTGGK